MHWLSFCLIKGQSTLNKDMDAWNFLSESGPGNRKWKEKGKTYSLMTGALIWALWVSIHPGAQEQCRTNIWGIKVDMCLLTTPASPWLRGLYAPWCLPGLLCAEGSYSKESLGDAESRGGWGWDCWPSCSKFRGRLRVPVGTGKDFYMHVSVFFLPGLGERWAPAWLPQCLVYEQVQNTPPQTHCFGMLVILWGRHLRNSSCRRGPLPTWKQVMKFPLRKALTQHQEERTVLSPEMGVRLNGAGQINPLKCCSPPISFPVHFHHFAII